MSEEAKFRVLQICYSNGSNPYLAGLAPVIPPELSPPEKAHLAPQLTLLGCGSHIFYEAGLADQFGHRSSDDREGYAVKRLISTAVLMKSHEADRRRVGFPQHVRSCFRRDFHAQRARPMFDDMPRDCV